MKRFKQNAIVFIAVVLGTVIGMFRGSEAKQKWMFRFMSRQDQKRQSAEVRRDRQRGKVLLDDIEMAAFHQQ
jgi:hypothetical protein